MKKYLFAAVLILCTYCNYGYATKLRMLFENETDEVVKIVISDRSFEYSSLPVDLRVDLRETDELVLNKGNKKRIDVETCFTLATQELKIFDSLLLLVGGNSYSIAWKLNEQAFCFEPFLEKNPNVVCTYKIETYREKGPLFGFKVTNKN